MNIETLTLLNYSVILPAIFFAFAIRGMTGFGSAIMLVPVLSLYFDPKLVVVLVGALDYAMSSKQFYTERRDVDWRIILPFVLVSYIGVIFGVLIFTQMETTTLKRIIGVVVIFFAIYSLFFAGRVVRKAGTYRIFFLGVSGGFLGAILGTGGPMAAMYLQLFAIKSFVANMAAIFVFGNPLRIAGYWWYGHYQGLFVVLLFSLIVAFVGFWFGEHFRVKVHEDTVKKIINTVLIVAGAVLLFQG